MRSGGTRFEANLGKLFSTPPVSKITRVKWTGGVAQAVEWPALHAQSPEFKLQSHQKGWWTWCTSIIPATWTVEIGGLKFKASLHKKLAKPLVKKQAGHNAREA
jgi:hypothetical protein